MTFNASNEMFDASSEMFNLELLTPALEDEIKAYAQLVGRHEACGYLYLDGGEVKFKGVANVAAEPEDSFVMPEYPQNAIAIFHSHTNGTDFSVTDKVMCRKMQIPWLLLTRNRFFLLRPSEAKVSGYAGRAWIWGVDDCYTLVQDVYRECLDIHLMEYPRPPLFDKKGDFIWKRPDWNPYEEYFASQGFFRVNEPSKEFDVILMNINSPTGNANHAAIMMDVSQGKILHHLYGRLSEYDFYGHWLKYSKTFLRHKDAGKIAR